MVFEKAMLHVVPEFCSLTLTTSGMSYDDNISLEHFNIKMWTKNIHKLLMSNVSCMYNLVNNGIYGCGFSRIFEELTPKSPVTCAISSCSPQIVAYTTNDVMMTEFPVIFLNYINMKLCLILLELEVVWNWKFIVSGLIITWSNSYIKVC